MTRSSVSFSLREELIGEEGEHVQLAFITITHTTLPEPLRFVSDGVNYVRDGVMWTGIWFDVQILSDNENRPQTKLKIQNVDRQIGEAILAMGSDPCRLQIELLSSEDFDTTVDPRAEVGTAHVNYVAKHLYLLNISMNALEVTATVKGWDYTQEKYPSLAATKDRLPGLFR